MILNHRFAFSGFTISGHPPHPCVPLPRGWVLGQPRQARLRLGRAAYAGRHRRAPGPRTRSSREESIRCHPLEAYLSCAIGQQGAEPKVGLFCTLKTVPFFSGKHKQAEKVRFEPTRQLNTAYTVSSPKTCDLTSSDVSGNSACLWVF